MANVALGKPIEEHVTNSSSATDGNASKYSAVTGFAEFSWPYMITVDLGVSCGLFCIRLLLWDGLGEANKQRDNRVYKYRLLTSVDRKTWKVIHDSLDGGGNGWQEFRFPNPLEARYVRVHGLSNSANDKFQIVQVEAHDNQPPDLDAEIVLARPVLTESDLDNEVGDGLPLQAKVQSIISGIEELIEKNEQYINPQPFRLLISQLRNQVSDVASLERGMDSIRREIITPVRTELEQSARFSSRGFWVGLVGGVLAIFSLSLSLWQGFRYNKPELQSNKGAVSASPSPSSKPANVSDLENHNNAPSAFSLDRTRAPFGTSHFTRQGDMWVQEYSDRSMARFALSGRVALNGCIGSLLYGISNFEVEIFVPDRGCATMECLARIKKGTWDALGSMENIR